MDFLGGHNLLELGMIDGQADGSNICLTGAWDMPVRTGKTHHEWAEGFEPYLRADEIFFGGTDLDYTFYIDAARKQDAIAAIYAIYDTINDFTELKTFESAEFGSYEVYIRDEIRIENILDGFCRGVLRMRQPVADLTGTIPPPDNVAPSIDGISFAGLGMTLLDITDDMNRPQAKQGKYTVYGREGCRIGKPSFRTLVLRLLVDRPSYSLFNASISSLRALLSAPNARVLNIDGYTREVFAKDGFKVSSVYSQGTAYSGIIDLKLTEIRVLTDYTILADGGGNILTDGHGVPLSKIFKQQ